MTATSRGDERFYELVGERRRLLEEAAGLRDLLNVHREARAALKGGKPTRVNSVEEWEAFQENQAALEELAGGADQAEARLNDIRKRLDAIPRDLLGGVIPAGLWVRYGATGVRVDREPGFDRPVLTEAPWPAVEASETGEIEDVRLRERLIEMGPLRRLVHLHPKLPSRVLMLGIATVVGIVGYLFGDDAYWAAGRALHAVGEALSSPLVPEAGGPEKHPAAPSAQGPLETAVEFGAMVILVMSVLGGLMNVLVGRAAQGLMLILLGGLFFVVMSSGPAILLRVFGM